MKNIIIFTISTLPFLLSSCYNELDLSKYREGSKIVLNCAASTDTVVMAHVSESKYFSDARNGFNAIADAHVELSVNGTYLEDMKWTPLNNDNSQDGFYISTYTPKAGDLIQVKAQYQADTAWAQDKIPVLTPIEKVETSAEIIDDPDANLSGGGTGKKYVITYRITFTDDIATNNYYCIRIDDGVVANIGGDVDYSSDPIFVAQRNAVDGSNGKSAIYGEGGRTFNDELFNGKNYTLTLKESGEYRGSISNLGGLIVRTRRIVLYSLSEDFYNYLTGILNESDESLSTILTDFGFIEPKQHYCNIVGGLGILGCSQESHYTQDITPIIEASKNKGH